MAPAPNPTIDQPLDAVRVAGSDPGAGCSVSVTTKAGVTTVRTGPGLTRSAVRGLVDAVSRSLRTCPSRIVLDVGAVDDFDSAGLAGLVEALRLGRAAGVELRLRGLSQAMLDYFSLVSVERLTAAEPGPEPRGILRRLGARALPVLESMATVGRLGADCVMAVLVDPWRGRRPRIDRTTHEFDHTAGGALPITGLIGFLLGLILAMQAWVQLRAWAAELYVADMVGVSVVTEIGPLMTAIVLAARSASANAAQLGSMVVGEEVDALRQMGIDPVRFLVVPKVVALALAAVALCLIFDGVAIVGAALFARGFADIGFVAFGERLELALGLRDLATAGLKCLAFGGCVGVVGCAEGLSVTGGSEGVGRATTRAVVYSVFLIIVVDALFVTLQRMVFA